MMLAACFPTDSAAFFAIIVTFSFGAWYLARAFWSWRKKK